MSSYFLIYYFPFNTTTDSSGFFFRESAFVFIFGIDGHGGYLLHAAMYTYILQSYFGPGLPMSKSSNTFKVIGPNHQSRRRRKI